MRVDNTRTFIEYFPYCKYSTVAETTAGQFPGFVGSYMPMFLGTYCFPFQGSQNALRHVP